MIHLNNFKKFLITEIGEANVKAYDIINHIKLPVAPGIMGHNYTFKSDEGIKYSINITDKMTDMLISHSAVKECDIITDALEDFYENTIAISFFTYTGDDENMYSTYDDKIITNKGDIYKIMSTLKKVLENYLNKNPNINYIFVGGQESEKKIDKKQRDNLYLRYFKKNEPEWLTKPIYSDFKNEWYHLIKIKK